MAQAKKKKAAKTATKATKKATKKTTTRKKSSPKKLTVQPKILTRSTESMPLAESTTLDTLCIVNGSDDNIALEIWVGAEEQTSDMTIKLDDTIIAENHAGNFPSTILGTNKSLNGKKLSIVAVITDTSRKTNFTSLSIQLTGGISTDTHNLSKTVNDEGASADYLCLIEFFKP